MDGIRRWRKTSTVSLRRAKRRERQWGNTGKTIAENFSE